MNNRRLHARPHRGRVRRAALVFAAVLGLVGASAAFAAVRLASGFGSHGIARLGAGEVLGVALQKDGRLIAVGYAGHTMLVQRLGKNGSRGSRFQAGRGVASAVAVQPDGKILVAGTTSPVIRNPGDNVPSAENGDMVLKRFNANGSLDRTFGSGGTAHARGAIAYAVVLGPHGTIVIAGFVRGADTTPRVAIARFRSNGKPDVSFGRRGFVTVDLGPFSEANAVAVQRDGKIVFAGDQRPDLRITNALIGRLLASGRVDRGFARNGVFSYFHPHGGAASSFKAIALDSANRVVGGGGDFQNSGQHALFVRLGRSGAPDRSFGSGGVITAPAEIDFIGGDLVAGAHALGIAGRGEIVATGRYQFGASGYAALWAITARGRLDQRAAPGGLVKNQLPSDLGGELTSIAVAADGSVYAGGDMQSFNRPTVGLVARYRGLPSR